MDYASVTASHSNADPMSLSPDSPLGLPMVDYPRSSTDHRIVAISTDRFIQNADPEGDGRQYYSLWCWAATLGMIVRYHGIPLHQENVVERIYPDYRNERATINQLMSLPKLMYTEDRVPYTVSMEVLDKTRLIEELAAGRPSMVVLQKKDNVNYHAYVLAAAILRVAPDGETPETAIIVNPDASHPAWEALPWTDLCTRFATGLAVDVTRHETTAAQVGS